MTPQEVLTEFEHSRRFPRAAMEAALANKEEMLPAFLREIERACEKGEPDLPFGNAYAIMFEILGQWEDPRSYLPLVRFLRLDEDTLDYLLDDILTERGSEVIAAVVGDDLTPMLEAILDPKANPFSRDQLISALVIIAFANPARRLEVEAVMDEIISRLEADADEAVVGSWAIAVAMLGMKHQEAAARAAIAALPKDNFFLNSKDLEELIAKSAANDENDWELKKYRRPPPIDAIADVSKWHCYSEKYIREMEARESQAEDRLFDFVEPQTFINPHRDVGRNDPCPCGSGKKYKKCCLN